jgi:RHS repeat-associated protein
LINKESINEYYPFGLVNQQTSSTQFGSKEQRYKFGSKELIKDFNLESYNFEARMYNPQIARFQRLDPMADKRVGLTPYNYVSNNPITRIDPTGMLDGEYEKDKDGNWQKTSTKGDDIGVDFYHTTRKTGDKEEQLTYVTDREGNWNTIKEGKKFLSGESRGDDANWATIFSEWNNGSGPETSFFEGGHQSNMEIMKDPAFQNNLFDFSSSGKTKDGFNSGFNLLDAATTGFSNMQKQMMGDYNMSFYKLGDKVLSLVNDSKSRSSFYAHLPVNNPARGTVWDGSGGNVIFNNRQTNTYQNYLFFAK